MNRAFLYDTTLRDGTQRENLSLSCPDKLNIAERLDAFGVSYIEGGWPGSNPKDVEFFERVRSLGLRQAKICAFGSTRRKNTPCDADSNTQALVAAQTPVVTLVGKSWDLHVRDVLGTTAAENLAMIGESVEYFKVREKEVVYDAEHFFDGYKADAEHALETLRTAARAGADFVVVCDTNGGSLPWEVEEIVRRVREELAEFAVALGIHAHDDGGCAVANSLAAVRAGCTMVQGTVNGYGERVANASLTSVVPDLQLKMGRACVDPDQLRGLTRLSRYVAEVCNIAHDNHLPYTGRSAFAHKGGIHVAAMLKQTTSYQHIDPALVGNEMRVVVSELSGQSNIRHLAARQGVAVDSERARQVLDEVKSLEHSGASFEGAEASVELMLRRRDSDYVAPFTLLDFMVVVEHRRGRGVFAEATLKVEVGGVVEHTAAEGNGPVDALGRALRKALRATYPRLQEARLTDYKVRVLDGDSGTAASVRVLVDFEQGARRWSTVGAGTNIIEASWKALGDSMEYALLAETPATRSERLETAAAEARAQPRQAEAPQIDTVARDS